MRRERRKRDARSAGEWLGQKEGAGVLWDARPEDQPCCQDLISSS